jgi:hypothetical protein
MEHEVLGEHGACDLIYRVPVWTEAGPALPSDQAHALPLLLHEFDRQEGLAAVLERGGVDTGASQKAALRRLLPRLVSYRYNPDLEARDYIFAGYRPSSLHVLSRVFMSSYRFRLEDLSHFATHGEFLIRVLEALKMPRGLDPEGILYCPAIDSPYPFKFAVVGAAEERNRDVYVRLLKQLLRTTESDEVFRERNFMELIRGFAKFGPAAATPEFQEVELRLWRLLSYLAARLRVKAGRLTDTKDADEVESFLAELHHVHGAFDDLVHLPGRMAAFFRSRFDLELSSLHEHTLKELDEIAARIDFDFDDMDRSLDVVAGQVSEFRRLGSASPLESLEAKDFDIKRADGDVEAEEPDTGWARTYGEKIFTGAKRFDTRRYDAVEAPEEDLLSEEDLDLDMDLNFGFGGGFGGDDDDDDDDAGWGEGDDDMGLDALDIDL